MCGRVKIRCSSTLSVANVSFCECGSVCVCWEFIFCDAVSVLSNGTGNVDDLLLLLFDRESRFLLGIVF